MNGEKEKIKNTVQLITLDNKHKPCYYQRCKVTIDTVNKKLFIIPFTSDESDAKPITVSFDGTRFAKVQNILLLDKVKNFGSCILFFSKANTAVKLFKIFQQHNVLNTILSANDLIEDFITKILNSCNSDEILGFKANIKQLVRKLSIAKQKKLKKLCGALFYQAVGESPETNTRKRKHDQLKNSIVKKEFVETENFKIHEFNHDEKNKKRLIIFTSTEHENCYEYFWNAFTKSYVCCGCNRLKWQKCSAKICKRLNGTEFVKYEKSKHICEPREYNPEKYKFDAAKQIVEASNFKVVKFEEYGVEKSNLIIFPSADRSRCYKYFLDGKTFCCSGCKVKINKSVTAKVCIKDGKEYVKLGAAQHVCETKIYMSEKHIFHPSAKFLTDNFKITEITRKGVTKKMLIVFDSSNKNLCYEYFYNTIIDCYHCCECRTKDTIVAAYVYKDDAGKDFVKLGNSQHVCDLREFNEEKYSNHLIVKKPLFEFMEHFFGGTKKKKLIVFTSDDKKHCYYFTWLDGRKYCCTKCSAQKYFIAAYMCRDGNGEEYVSINDKKHVCKPVKYEPEKYCYNIIKPPAYQVIHRRYGKNIIKKMVIFDAENRELCYEYYWSAPHKYFKCSPCHKNHKISVTAKLIENNVDGEHLILSPNEHKCVPKKFKPEHGKIIKLPCFKLNITNDEKTGAERRHLMIFDSTDKEKFYSYNYDKNKDQYFCGSCTNKRKYVTARICIDENGEDFVELGGHEHICEPKTAAKIVKEPNFQIISYSKNGKRKNALIIFESNDKNLCYQYSHKGHKTYFCDGCNDLGTKNNAMIRQDNDTKNEFIELLHGPHICQPKPYSPDDFIKTVKLPDFKVEATIKNGEQRKYLIVYSNLEKKLGYKYYYCNTKKYFVCCSCQRATRTTNIIARVRRNEVGDDDFVELCEKEHICKPQRYT